MDLLLDAQVVNSAKDKHFRVSNTCDFTKITKMWVHKNDNA